MKRGLNQVLFQFMPDKTFDNPDNNTIEQVDNISGKDITEQVNAEYLVRRISAAVSDWEGGSQGFRGPDLEHYTIIQPENVISKAFPLVLRCEDCSAVDNYRRKREDLKHNQVECQNCGGNSLHQLHHVLICPNCSEIDQIQIPPCNTNNHGWQYVKLDDRAESYRNFRWICGLCDSDSVIETGMNWNAQCDSCGERMRATVHRASQAYRTHHLKDVDINYTYDLEEDSEDIHRFSDIALGAAYQVYDHPESTIAEMEENDSGETGQMVELLESDIIDEEQKEQIRSKFGGQLEGRERVADIIGQVRDLKQTDRTISRNHLNYLRTLEEKQVDSLESLDIRSPTRLDRYTEMLEKAGIADIRLTTEFPIVTAVYGYHRTFEDPEEDDYPRVRAFPYSMGGSSIPIYGSHTETEAVFIRLDPVQVGQWLSQNNLLDIDIEDATDSEILARIHGEMEEIGPYGDVDDSSLVSQEVHGLIHTLAHKLIEEGAMLSGIEQTSLAEFLFPEALSLVIYSNQSQSFTIGGLYTLIERSLDNWIESAMSESTDCIYDPVCGNEGATCHACTHISEIGCQFFNQNLSRGFLYGETDRERDASGYWDLG